MSSRGAAVLAFFAITMIVAASMLRAATVDDAKLAYKVALVALSKGDYQTAEVKFREALESMKDNGALWYNLGVTQSKLGKFTDAKASLTQSLKLLPEADRDAREKAQDALANVEYELLRNDERPAPKSPIVGTISDVDPGKNRFQLTPDDDRNGSMRVDNDAVSTQYNGFGSLINGAPEIFVGSTGFAHLYVGDRVEVRGVGGSGGIIAAEYVTFLGRPVPRAQTGVSQTRTPQSISAPTVSGTTPAGPTPKAAGAVEGVVRQVNVSEGRLVMETDQREVVTIQATSSTPVYYLNNVYHIGNLEPGDRIRIHPDNTNSIGGELQRARTIDVIQNVEERGGTIVQVGALTGRVTLVDRRRNTVRVQSDRGEVAVDLATAVDNAGRHVHAADMQIGDRLDLSGSYTGDVFVATTVIWR